jgi:hypothetical protein
VASCDPCDERKYDSKNNEHNDCASGVEIFVAQKYGEGAAIKKQSGD